MLSPVVQRRGSHSNSIRGKSHEDPSRESSINISLLTKITPLNHNDDVIKSHYISLSIRKIIVVN